VLCISEHQLSTWLRIFTARLELSQHSTHGQQSKQAPPERCLGIHIGAVHVLVCMHAPAVCPMVYTWHH
jgi:hypothetical protein